jgi:RHS repeat-associated protein
VLTDDWGVEVAVSGSTVNQYRAFGAWVYERDAASRLYVMARELRGNLGRWVNRDPIGFGGANSNTLVDNRPAFEVDPSGRVKQLFTNYDAWQYGLTKGDESCCGWGYAEFWFFNDKGLVPCEGWFVQKITTDAVAWACDGSVYGGSIWRQFNTPEHPCVFYEAWSIHQGRKLPYEGTHGTTDSWKYPGARYGSGSWYTNSEVKFFCRSLIGDLADASKNPNWSNYKRGGCCDTQSRSRPCWDRKKAPDFGDKTAPGSHETVSPLKLMAGSQFECCPECSDADWESIVIFNFPSWPNGIPVRPCKELH